MKEKYLLELGGENTDLGKYEALELLKFQKYSPFLEKDYERIIVISTSKKIEKNIVARLTGITCCNIISICRNRYGFKVSF